MSAITEKTVAELEIDMGELRMEREGLVAQKQAWEAQVAEINAALIVRLPQPVYQKKMRARAEVLKQKSAVEIEIQSINARLRELNMLHDIRKAQANSLSVEDIRLLVGIRDRWHEFSMEKTNHKKAREVAFQVSQELRAILKKHFQ